MTKGEIVELHEKVNKEKGADFRPLWKLNERHFQCQNSERQRVILATQVLSNSVAEGLKLFFKDKDAYVEFLSLWNQWFDCANSRMGKHKKNDLKGGFGAAGEATLQRQKAILERAYNYALSMRAILKRDKNGKAVPKRALVPFQVFLI